MKYASVHPVRLHLQGLQCLLSQLPLLQHPDLHHSPQPGALPHRAFRQSVFSLKNSGALGKLPFLGTMDSKDGVIVKIIRYFPKNPALLVPLTIILYLQYASAAI